MRRACARLSTRSSRASRLRARRRQRSSRFSKYWVARATSTLLARSAALRCASGRSRSSSAGFRARDIFDLHDTRSTRFQVCSFLRVGGQRARALARNVVSTPYASLSALAARPLPQGVGLYCSRAISRVRQKVGRQKSCKSASSLVLPSFVLLATPLVRGDDGRRGSAVNKCCVLCTSADGKQ